MPSGEDLGELGDVPGQGVQVRAAAPDLAELGFLLVIEVVRVGEDPAGDVTGFRRGRHGRRGDAEVAERLHVVADGAVAAAVAAVAELGVQLPDVGAALVPPLMQVRLAVIQQRRPAVHGLGQQPVSGLGTVEAADGFLGQAGAAPVSRKGWA